MGDIDRRCEGHLQILITIRPSTIGQIQMVRLFFVVFALMLTTFGVCAQTVDAAGGADPFAHQTNGVFVCQGEASSHGGATWNCNEPFTDTNGKTVRNLKIDPAIRNLVWIIVGQSNREAEALTAYVPTHANAIDNFNTEDGAVYAYSDPPLGSSYIGTAIPDGGPGHVGGRTADLFMDTGQWDRVIVVPIAIGGAAIADLAPGGRIADRFCKTMERLKARGIVPGHNVTFGVDFGQGESDLRSASEETYTRLWNQMYASWQACGFVGRVFVSVETWIFNLTWPPVQAAQAAVVNNRIGIYAGANADSIGSWGRVLDMPPEGTTHFNDNGLAELAPMIVKAARASGWPY
jgi:hypothetical protein